ncbi:hypothetical protein CcaverHIS002_0301490 [Cutaneotrichosporon cavernicola]|uniref:Pathogen-related protein n=1 Tax=Cutaneotrichosporon cavernicola TaxID=279322 RepID=A0AA48IAH7_9TREE|nr:uncharacterized protein CcaverHIS019_0301450 [Cutaneotrichosporon cavernicola]BEI82281.1 hypothetical protein CcaverHIS002_0301490 [Cutaneotrichosporon cavernicola]BEI90075.1 hypothetical protein CcaverHIS019_0301450 [Cutaneotrichosporon cavernicola]BEI97849.1 hypothetical protein CcaverHIS631_0301480 [Cutaneotrichosporon cavernicola]BEJ05626.1 hypothetical protein CcaverHIS641_0301480 [Cutaneotrichosporon cavernicola]
MSLPDIVTNPDAVLGDKVAWRFKRAPNYSKTRKWYEETKLHNHEPGSLPNLVENLVKNWEIEASFKTNFDEWRTVVQDKYKFYFNGGEAKTGPEMLKVGTYNALLTATEFYDPEKNDFTASHKSFKRMMPVFAWEVVEVYSGPPVVAMKWRHWGEMKNDYVGFNAEGKKVRVKAHGGLLDIEGILIATVNDKLQAEKLEVWMDPRAMWNEVTKTGNKLIIEDASKHSDGDENEEETRCPITGQTGVAPH